MTKKGKKRSVLGLLLALLLVLTGCERLLFWKKEEPAPDPEPLITQGYPVEVGGVTVEDEPEKVLLLSATLVEQVQDLGLTHQIAGIPTVDGLDIPGAVSCGTALVPDRQAIYDSQVYLLVTQQPLPEADAQWLESQHIDVITLEPPTTLEELSQSYHQLALVLKGEVTGPDIADSALEPAKDYLQALHQAVGEAETLPSVLYLRQVDGVVATGDSMVHELLTYAGFDNLAADFSGWHLSPEQWEEPEVQAGLRELDYLIYDPEEIDEETLKAHPLWGALAVVQEDRMLTTSYPAFERQGLAMVDEVEWLASRAYPDLSLPVWKMEERGGGSSEPSADLQDPQQDPAEGADSPLTDPETVGQE